MSYCIGDIHMAMRQSINQNVDKIDVDKPKSQRPKNVDKSTFQFVDILTSNLFNHESELASLHCWNTGSWKIGKIFIISRGPILVNVHHRPFFDSLSAGSENGDSHMIQSVVCFIGD